MKPSMPPSRQMRGMLRVLVAANYNLLNLCSIDYTDSMLTQYIKAAMHEAHYELMENGRFYGSIRSCQGCWAEGETLEQCRDELESVLEDWILIKVGHRDTMPVIDGIDINPQPEYAEAA